MNGNKAQKISELFDNAVGFMSPDGGNCRSQEAIERASEDKLKDLVLKSSRPSFS